LAGVEGGGGALAGRESEECRGERWREIDISDEREDSARSWTWWLTARTFSLHFTFQLFLDMIFMYRSFR
jgi:hypothetical protein